MAPDTTEDNRENASYPGIGTKEEGRDADVITCAAYENLIRELELREPTEEDFSKLEKHEANCASGTHSEEGVEKALGLRSGALRNGSPQDGVPSPRQVVDSLIAKHISAKALA